MLVLLLVYVSYQKGKRKSRRRKRESTERKKKGADFEETSNWERCVKKGEREKGRDGNE